MLENTATNLFYTIYPYIKEDEDKFFNFFHVPPASFDGLLELGSYARSSDSFIFKQTPLYYKQMMDNTLHIPAATIITRTVATITSFIFLGDEAFGLLENILTPYGGNILSEKKIIFNY
ncbi:hypothetical protein J437_LFUL002326 [Ladona fulva]|uniref:Uncharacterized protein n=1 Tax=Ladona fulva TaxID=123851 RepID=A0A8K0K8B8_LADFU|nr:hypothetical protein J437_LFUL002326 [Ladona fulva]